MDVDEDDDGTQKPLVAKDYAIEVDFADLEDEEKEVSLDSDAFHLSSSFSSDLADPLPSSHFYQNGGEEYGEELENAIAKIDAEIVRMAPNMKAADKFVPPASPRPRQYFFSNFR